MSSLSDFSDFPLLMSGVGLDISLIFYLIKDENELLRRWRRGLLFFFFPFFFGVCVTIPNKITRLSGVKTYFQDNTGGEKREQQKDRKIMNFINFS